MAKSKEKDVKKETKKLQDFVIIEKNGNFAINSSIVGQSAYDIANMAGISVPEKTKILITKLDGVGDKYPLSKEKLSPILAYYVVKDYNGDKIIYFKNLISFFYTYDELPQLLEEVQKERQLKQQRYGINNYKSYMEKEKVNNPLFQRFKQIKN